MSCSLHDSNELPTDSQTSHCPAKSPSIVSAPRTVERSGSTCPSTRNARNEIREEFYTTFEDSIRPMFCGGSFGWSRVAFLNTSDPTEQCPAPWREINATSTLRLCGRQASSGPSCSSVMYSTSGARYNRVTYGQPRMHIWSYVGGLDEDNAANAGSNCPCVNPGVTVPSYVGNNYFCETGNPGVWSGQMATYHVDDPLWDGEGCRPNSECCSFNSPPWFTVQLPSSTTEEKEVRICGNDRGGTAHEDTPIQVMELYIK